MNFVGSCCIGISHCMVQKRKKYFNITFSMRDVLKGHRYDIQLFCNEAPVMTYVHSSDSTEIDITHDPSWLVRYSSVLVIKLRMTSFSFHSKSWGKRRVPLVPECCDLIRLWRGTNKWTTIDGEKNSASTRAGGNIGA